jgi:hypothetical protein
MRAVISLVLGVMLVTPGSAAENKSHMQTLSNVSKAKAETQKEIARNLRREAPAQGPKSNTQPSASKAK